jgi:hypothetical protein
MQGKSHSAVSLNTYHESDNQDAFWFESAFLFPFFKLLPRLFLFQERKDLANIQPEEGVDMSFMSQI